MDRYRPCRVLTNIRGKRPRTLRRGRLLLPRPKGLGTFRPPLHTGPVPGTWGVPLVSNLPPDGQVRQQFHTYLQMRLPEFRKMASVRKPRARLQTRVDSWRILPRMALVHLTLSDP